MVLLEVDTFGTINEVSPYSPASLATAPDKWITMTRTVCLLLAKLSPPSTLPLTSSLHVEREPALQITINTGTLLRIEGLELDPFKCH